MIQRRIHPDNLQLGLAACLTSLLSATYFFRTHQALLYGDAVAHISISRRVTDSLTPGLKQLGTVWLPLPHLLSAPLLAFDPLWISGLGGSLPSMAAYVFATIAIFRLVRQTSSRPAAWLAAIFFAANPNLIYLQATAMTETIFLACALWATVHIAAFSRAALAGDTALARRATSRAALWLSAAMLTRYDGWWLNLCALLGVILIAWRAPAASADFRRVVLRFALLCAIIPAAWLAYNAALYGNALEFADGPYSARAIAQRTAAAGQAPHPGFHSLPVANTFFIKSAKLQTGEGGWQHLFFWLAALGACLSLFRRDQRPALLLLLLLPFYALSIAYGGVPIFMPQWWPHSYYNVRYGIELLPAIAVFTAYAFDTARQLQPRPLYQNLVLGLFLLLTAGSYASVWRATPITLREARVNATDREHFEDALAAELRFAPPGSRLIMYTGDYSGALRKAGIPFRRVINEGNYSRWHAALAALSSPNAHNGLAAPDLRADFIVAVAGDPIAKALSKQPLPASLESVAVIHSAGKPPAIVYRIIH